MIKAIEELLKSNSISQEVAEALSGEWKTHTSVLNEEAKNLRTDNETLSKNYEEIMKSKSDLDTQLLGLDDKIAQAKKDGQGELQRQLESEKENHTELQKNLDNLQKANTKLKLDQAVMREMDKFDVKKEDKELVSFRLRANVTLAEDKIVYNDGDNSSDLQDGFKNYFAINTSRLNPVGGGGGSGAEGGGSGGAKLIERAAFDKLNPSQQSSYIADGGKVT